jgi:hypothetical protein
MKYKDGDIKIRDKFLFLPLYLDGKWWWLQFVTILYRYYEGYSGNYWNAETVLRFKV